MKKYLLSLTIALTVLSGCGSSDATTETVSETTESTNTTSESNESTETNTDESAEDTETASQTGGDNLLTPVEEVFVSDDDFDNMLGSEGDTVYTVEEGTEKTGLVTTVSVTDSGDGVVNLDEPIHMTVQLENTSNATYDIQQLHIDGGIMFEDNNWHDMKVTGGDPEGYELDSESTRLDANGLGNFDLAPGDKFIFEVDGSIGAGEEDKNIERYDTEKETDYVNFEFMATNNDDGMVYYYSTDDQTLNIDLTK